MMRTILFLSVSVFIFTPVFTMAGDVGSNDPVAEVVTGETEAVTSEVIVLEDGTEEVMITTPVAEAAHAFADERVVAIQSEARGKIQAVVEEIHQLADKSDEGELQKKIERIKLDAEIARFTIYMDDAEDAEDYDLVNTLRDEIEHLKNMDKPAIGVPMEQTAPKS